MENNRPWKKPILEVSWSSRLMEVCPNCSVKDVPRSLLSISRRRSVLQFRSSKGSHALDDRGRAGEFCSRSVRHPSLLQDESIHMLRLLMRGSPQRCRKASRTRTSRKGSTWKSRRLKGRTASSVTGKSHTSTNVLVLEHKVQDGSVLLFKFPYGGDVMDRRSRDGYFSGRFKNFRDPFRELHLFPILNYWTQELLHP